MRKWSGDCGECIHAYTDSSIGYGYYCECNDIEEDEYEKHCCDGVPNCLHFKSRYFSTTTKSSDLKSILVNIYGWDFVDRLFNGSAV